MGIFDDMIAAPASAPAAPPAGKSGIFDDMLQEPQKETAPQQMSGDVPVQSTLQTFFQNLPKYPGVLAQRFGDLAKGAVTGQILPETGSLPGSTPGGQQGDIPALYSAALTGTPLAPGGLPMKLAPFKGPTEAALDVSHTARYNSPEITNLQLKPEAGQDLANIIRTDLKDTKLDKFNAKPFYDIADRLEKPRFGDNLSIADLEAARQDAQVAPATTTANDKRGSSVIRNAIDSYLGNIPQSHVLSGDAAAANDALLKARSDFAALKRSQDVTSALGRAENQAGATFSGHNLDNATRQQLKPILNQKEGVSKVKAFQDYTPEEIDALKQAVNGTVGSNITRSIGKRLGSGGGHGSTFMGLAADALGHTMGLDPFASAALGMGTMAAGHGVGALANRMTLGRGDYLGNLLRSRSALANEMRANPQMVPAFWPQLLRIPPAGLGTPSVPTLGINTKTL